MPYRSKWLFSLLLIKTKCGASDGLRVSRKKNRKSKNLPQLEYTQAGYENGVGVILTGVPNWLERTWNPLHRYSRTFLSLLGCCFRFFILSHPTFCQVRWLQRTRRCLVDISCFFNHSLTLSVSSDLDAWSASDAITHASTVAIQCFCFFYITSLESHLKLAMLALCQTPM